MISRHLKTGPITWPSVRSPHTARPCNRIPLRLAERLLLPALILITLSGCSSPNNYRLAGFKKQDDGTIAFDLRRGDQRIRAICNASQSNCSNLALKAGNYLDCYMHARGWDFIPDADFPHEPAYGVKIDPYAEGGMVCHSGEGHGKLLISRNKTCVDVKEVTLANVGGTFKLPFRLSKPFLQAPRDEQIKYLNSTDPDFAKGSPADQAAYLDFLLKPKPHQVSILPDPELWSAYVPVVFDDGQIKRFIQELNAGADEFSQNREKRPLLPSTYQGYEASAANPLRFCKPERDHYFNERGKEVRDDTVLLTVLESSPEKH